MPVRPRQKLKAESRVFPIRTVIRFLSRRNAAVNRYGASELEKSLDALLQTVEKYTTPGENGEYIKVEEADRMALARAYRDVIALCDGIRDLSLQPELKKNRSYKALAQSTEKLKAMLTADMRSLTALHAKLGRTLPEALENTRNAVISIDNISKIKAVGGSMSSRLPITVSTAGGHKFSGMFTKTASYDFVQRSDAIIQGIIDAVPGQKAKETLRQYLLVENTKDPDRRETKHHNAGYFMERLYKKGTPLTDVLKEICDKKVKDKFSDYFQSSDLEKITQYAENHPREIRKLANLYNMSGRRLHLADGENIDGKNSAMSMLASLLGRPDLLANSVQMTIRCGEDEYSGTFMEFVDGMSDLSHLNKDDPYLKCKSAESALDGRPVLKDGADLGVIDVIAGNIDRHLRNILYSYGKDANGNVYVKGIKGIDNDGSFGRKDSDELTDKQSRASKTGQLRVISASMRDAVMNLSGNTLKLALQPYGISAEGIQGAADRLERIKSGIRTGSIEVVKDNEWKNKTLKDVGHIEIMADGKMNYAQNGIFNQIYMAHSKNEIEDARNRAARAVSDENIKLSEAQTQEARRFYEFDDADRSAAIKAISDTVAELRSRRSIFYGSREYEEMYDSARAVQKEVAGCTAERFIELATDLQNKTQAYINMKDDQGKALAEAAKKNGSDTVKTSSNTIRRVLAAGTALDFTRQFLDESSIPAWEEYKAQNKEYAKYRAKQKAAGKDGPDKNSKTAARKDKNGTVKSADGKTGEAVSNGSRGSKKPVRAI